MRETFDITGMTCAACSSRVQKAAGEVPGVACANVNLLKNSMELDYDGSSETARPVARVPARRTPLTQSARARLPRRPSARGATSS